MAQDKVSRDAVYAQLYFEMRRYRDYELTAATWWTALLLAVLSGLVLISPSSGSGQNVVSQFLKESWGKAIFTVPLFGLGLGILHALHYTNMRYDLLRAFCSAELEPSCTSKLRDLMGEKRWTPLCSIVAIIWGLLVGIFLVLWQPCWVAGVGISAVWTIFAVSYWRWHSCQKTKRVEQFSKAAT